MTAPLEGDSGRGASQPRSQQTDAHHVDVDIDLEIVDDPEVIEIDQPSARTLDVQPSPRVAAKGSRTRKGSDAAHKAGAVLPRCRHATCFPGPRAATISPFSRLKPAQLRRKRDAKKASLIARTVWLLVHCLILAAILCSPSDLRRDIVDRNVKGVAIFVFLLVLNTVMYIWVSLSNPSYIEPATADSLSSCPRSSSSMLSFSGRPADGPPTHSRPASRPQPGGAPTQTPARPSRAAPPPLSIPNGPTAARFGPHPMTPTPAPFRRLDAPAAGETVPGQVPPTGMRGGFRPPRSVSYVATATEGSDGSFVEDLDDNDHPLHPLAASARAQALLPATRKAPPPPPDAKARRAASARAPSALNRGSPRPASPNTAHQRSLPALPSPRTAPLPPSPLHGHAGPVAEGLEPLHRAVSIDVWGMAAPPLEGAPTPAPQRTGSPVGECTSPTSVGELAGTSRQPLPFLSPARGCVGDSYRQRASVSSPAELHASLHLKAACVALVDDAGRQPHSSFRAAGRTPFVFPPAVRTKRPHSDAFSAAVTPRMAGALPEDSIKVTWNIRRVNSGGAMDTCTAAELHPSVSSPQVSNGGAWAELLEQRPQDYPLGVWRDVLRPGNMMHSAFDDSAPSTPWHPRSVPGSPPPPPCDSDSSSISIDHSLQLDADAVAVSAAFDPAWEDDTSLKDASQRRCIMLRSISGQDLERSAWIVTAAVHRGVHTIGRWLTRLAELRFHEDSGEFGDLASDSCDSSACGDPTYLTDGNPLLSAPVEAKPQRATWPSKLTQACCMHVCPPGGDSEPIGEGRSTRKLNLTAGPDLLDAHGRYSGSLMDFAGPSDPMPSRMYHGGWSSAPTRPPFVRPSHAGTNPFIEDLVAGDDPLRDAGRAPQPPPAAAARTPAKGGSQKMLAATASGIKALTHRIIPSPGAAHPPSPHTELAEYLATAGTSPAPPPALRRHAPGGADRGDAGHEPIRLLGEQSGTSVPASQEGSFLEEAGSPRRTLFVRPPPLDLSTPFMAANPLHATPGRSMDLSARGGGGNSARGQSARAAPSSGGRGPPPRARMSHPLPGSPRTSEQGSVSLAHHLCAVPQLPGRGAAAQAGARQAPHVRPSGPSHTSTARQPPPDWFSPTNPGRTCPYCVVWQPLRAKHCHDCGACVRRFDHHCAWIGNCVGEKNHRIFLGYLSTQLALLIWAFMQCVSAFELNASPNIWILHQLHLLLAVLVLVLSFMFVGGLWAYHVYLMLTNQTTYEASFRERVPYLKDLGDTACPFNAGILTNLRQFWGGNAIYVLHKPDAPQTPVPRRSMPRAPARV